jgi:Cu-Zn family superoxide dismutase
MKYWASIAAGLLVLFTAWGKEPSPKATAELKNAQGQAVGTATFESGKQGVLVRLNVRNLPPGVHGIHIHEAGKCDAPDFKTAGAHFNPTGKHHGSMNPQGEHAGDLENLRVGPRGTARVTLTAKGVTLGEGENSLFHPGGTSLVIHADPDDLKTDPAGNSGVRIVCGVIAKK